MAKEGPKKVMEVMLGVTLVELESCNDVTAEFAVVRKAYHKQALLHHPDKGGDQEYFREMKSGFEALRDMYSNNSLKSFASLLSSGRKAHAKKKKKAPAKKGKKGEKESDSQSTHTESQSAEGDGEDAADTADDFDFDLYASMYANKYQNFRMPTFDFFQTAEAAAEPYYKVEIAKTSRATCKKVVPKKNPEMFQHHDFCGMGATIAQGSVKVSKYNEQFGYGNPEHLYCWKVAQRVWQELPDPDKNDNVEDFVSALHGIDGVALAGFSDLPPHAQRQVAEHCMIKAQHAGILINKLLKAADDEKPAPKKKRAKKAKKVKVEDDSDEEFDEAALQESSSAAPAKRKARKFVARPSYRLSSTGDVSEHNSYRAAADRAAAAEQANRGVAPAPAPAPSSSSSSSNSSSSSSSGALVARAPSQVAVRRAVFDPKPPRDGPADALKGKTIVMTGIYREVGGGVGLNLGKDKLKRILESFGGKVTSSISGKTDILMVGQEPGASKVMQARKNHLAMWDTKELLDRLKGGQEAVALPDDKPMLIEEFSSGFWAGKGANARSNSIIPQLKGEDKAIVMGLQEAPPSPLKIRKTGKGMGKGKGAKRKRVVKEEEEDEYVAPPAAPAPAPAQGMGKGKRAKRKSVVKKEEEEYVAPPAAPAPAPAQGMGKGKRAKRPMYKLK